MCTEVAKTQDPEARRVKFMCTYDKSLAEEGKCFSQWTPSGSMEATITNPNVRDMFEPGRYYYIDITLRPEPEQASPGA